jgi:hypothetical protein
MIMVVDRGGCRTIGSGLEKDMDSGFWGFEKEREEHCIVIPRIAKAEGFRGVALGHRDGSHGGGLREEPKSLFDPFQGFRIIIYESLEN